MLHNLTIVIKKIYMLYSQFKNRCQVLTIDAREKMIKFGRYWKFPLLFSGKNPSVLFLLGKEGMEIIFFCLPIAFYRY